MSILDRFKKRKKEPEKKLKEERKEEPKIVLEPTEEKPKPARKITKREFVELAGRVLRSPHITEKATDLGQQNKYIFKVGPQANKIEIKKAIQQLYGVEVTKVNVVNVAGKKRRLGRNEGFRPGYRKAVVTLAEGEKIEVMPR